MELREAETRLLREGLVRRDVGGLRTAPRWHGAMMRAALRLLDAGDPGEDLRVPVAAALLELLPDASDAEVAAMAAVLLPLEAAEAGMAMDAPPQPPSA